MSGNIHQSDEDKLKATVKQKEKDRVISGALDSSNPETDDDSIPTGEVRETPIALLYAYDDPVSQTWERLRSDGSGRLLVKPVQATAAELKTEVTPSGDMARKAYYDRDPTPIVEFYEGVSLATHTWTARWTYTVPSNRNAFHEYLYGTVMSAIATADKYARIRWEANIASAGYDRYAFHSHVTQDANYRDTGVMLSCHFLLEDGDIIRGSTAHNDTGTHSMYVSATVTEFDE